MSKLRERERINNNGLIILSCIIVSCIILFIVFRKECVCDTTSNSSNKTKRAGSVKTKTIKSGMIDGYSNTEDCIITVQQIPNDPLVSNSCSPGTSDACFKCVYPQALATDDDGDYLVNLPIDLSQACKKTCNC